MITKRKRNEPFLTDAEKVGSRRYKVTASGCWEWKLFRNALGYGVVGVGSRTNGTKKLMSAHRLSWTVYKGPIPLGLCVLHRCDNPPCINPEHLFLGTNEDNMKDMAAKGRTRVLRGSMVGTAKLFPRQVRKIKQLFGILNDCQIARAFEVSDSLIWNIRKGISWRHISADETKKLRRLPPVKPRNGLLAS
jgi:hypothetical protein